MLVTLLAMLFLGAAATVLVVSSRISYRTAVPGLIVTALMLTVRAVALSGLLETAPPGIMPPSSVLQTWEREMIPLAIAMLMLAWALGSHVDAKKAEERGRQRAGGESWRR